jgi:predicted RNase H-like nuclease (RuvC/YqgF family)
MDYQKTVAGMRRHLGELARGLQDLQDALDLLSSEALLRQELDARTREVRELNHQLEEQECEIRWLRKQLKDRGMEG